MKTALCTSLIAAVIMTTCQPAFLAAGGPAGGKVVWQRTLYAGFLQAQKEKRPLVVLFTYPAKNKCEWCDKLDDEVIDTIELQSLATRAVFVRVSSADEDTKGNYAQLLTDLKIERVPTTVVLDVTETSIVESGRVVGFFKRPEFVDHLNKVLKAKSDPQGTDKRK